MNLWVELVLVSYAHSIGSAGLFLVVVFMSGHFTHRQQQPLVGP